MAPNAKHRAAGRALVVPEVARAAHEAAAAGRATMRVLSPLCQRDLALIGGVHHCMPVLAPTIPGSGRSIVTSAVTELPKRIDIDRISKKLFRVKVDGRITIPKTRSPFAVFGSLAVQGWSGKVALWRDGKSVGARDIEAETGRIAAAHDRLMLRKRRYR